MKINVGSKNKTKFASVEDAVRLYPELFPSAEVVGVEIDNDLYGHPKGIEETVEGAVYRAKQAFKNCAYSFGLEGGLIEVPQTQSGYMEVGVCAIYDGKEIYLGLSPAFEWPFPVTQMIVKREADASQALYKLGLTKHEKLGNVEGGGVGFLTGKRLTREEFTKYSIIMALIRLDKAELYGGSR